MVDFVCDLVNPVLLLSSVFLIGRLSASDKRGVFKLGFYLFWNLVVTYGMLYIESSFSLFAGFGLDYSTHTAFALAVAIILILLLDEILLIAGILAVYCIAMVYQEYHTVGDILVTVVVVAPFYAIGFMFFHYSRDKATTCI